MRIKELFAIWERGAAAPRTAAEYAIRLPVHDAARVHALAEMCPGRTVAEIVTDLLSAALDELETSLPYRQGSRVIATDDHDDPVYEDVGPTPRFVRLAREHERRLLEAPGTAAHAAEPHR